MELEADNCPLAPDPCFCGAIEGTRTPTPLPVHGPEPCASANSATMASGQSSRQPESCHREDLHFYFTDAPPAVKPRRTILEERSVHNRFFNTTATVSPASFPIAFRISAFTGSLCLPSPNAMKELLKG